MAEQFSGMYEALKSVAKKLVPRAWMLENEIFLRRLYSFRLRGNAFQCNVCGSGLSGFIPLQNGEQLCPFCGSLPRNRRLWQLMSEELELKEGAAVLDFSPSRCLFRAMKKINGIDYVSTDFAGEFHADQSYDITAIPEPDERFDYILCFHVLEHIGNDLKAMQELFRVLKKGGKALIQTPFKEGEIYENDAIISPEDRLRHFGQEDHVRIYCVSGLKRRLEKAGFALEDRNFVALEDDSALRLGLKETEIILIASK